MSASTKSTGWSWLACLLGPIWYLTHGMIRKGSMLLLIDLFTIRLAIPIVAIYSGLRGRSDVYELQLQNRSKFSLDEL